jgi:hypothetical protein
MPNNPVWYVSAGGSDLYPGYDAGKPVATVSAALARIRSLYRDGKFKVGESAVIVVSGTITASGSFNSMVEISGVDEYPPIILVGDPVRGGVLDAARSGESGRVLYVANNRVTLGGGLKLTGGRMMYGGAVCVGAPGASAGGEFIMAGGEIRGNVGGSGGGVMVYKGSMTMSGGVIRNNTNGFNRNKGSGGGVYLNEYAVFTMNGGTIERNGGEETENGGGVLAEGRARFVMTNGNILNNVSTGRGGGVFMLPYGIFVLSNGTISGNKTGVSGGGGVYLSSLGNAFTRTGGTVGGNSPDEIGG